MTVVCLSIPSPWIARPLAGSEFPSIQISSNVWLVTYGPDCNIGSAERKQSNSYVKLFLIQSISDGSVSELHIGDDATVRHLKPFTL